MPDLTFDPRNTVGLTSFSVLPSPNLSLCPIITSGPFWGRWTYSLELLFKFSFGWEIPVLCRYPIHHPSTPNPSPFLYGQFGLVPFLKTMKSFALDTHLSQRLQWVCILSPLIQSDWECEELELGSHVATVRGELEHLEPLWEVWEQN